MGKSERLSKEEPFDDRSYSESAFEKKLKQHRHEKEKFKKMEKERLKEMETLEEKRARRMAKKLRKEEQRKGAGGNTLPETIPYTDTNNPFNDTNLTEVFVWNKKLEVEGKANLSKREIEKLARRKIYNNVEEMEELKRNREARLAAKEDMEMIARDKDRSQYSDFRKQEDEFHLKQAKLRSEIRIKDRRAKPIDMLAKFIFCSLLIIFYRYVEYEKEDNMDEFDFEDPIAYIKGCSLEDFEDLKYDELFETSLQIRDKISNAGRGVDVGFFEALLDVLNPYMAKQRLKELHTKMLKIRLRKIREEQSREMSRFDSEHQIPQSSISQTIHEDQVCVKIIKHFFRYWTKI